MSGLLVNPLAGGSSGELLEADHWLVRALVTPIDPKMIEPTSLGQFQVWPVWRTATIQRYIARGF